MGQICLAIPILEGTSDDARDFMRELEQSRKSEYDLSELRIGITKEVWLLAQGTSGELLVAYMETDNFANALGLFSSSQDDLWFKRRLADSTGVDLNTPPEMSLPELLSSYKAAVPA